MRIRFLKFIAGIDTVQKVELQTTNVVGYNFGFLTLSPFMRTQAYATANVYMTC